MKRIVVVGAVPPPLGGVAVFVERTLAQYRLREDAVAIHILPRQLSRLFLEIIWNRRSEVHINTMNVVVLAVLWVAGRLSDAVVYDHNHSRRLIGAWWAPFVYAVLRRVRGVRVANPSLIEGHRQHGVRRSSVEVFDPFLPPPLDREQELWRRLPCEAREVLQDSHRCVVINSAWKVVRDEQGRELYGLGMTLELAAQIQSTHRDVHFLLFLGVPPDEQWSQALLRDAGALPNVTLVVGDHVMWPALRRAAAFLRTTSTDGDSVSVKEALYLGTPVIASDVVSRPPGVELYRFGDMPSLRSSLLSVLGRG